MYCAWMVAFEHGTAPTAFVGLVAHPLRWRLLKVLAESDYRVRELVAQVDQPQNLVSYHLRLLRRGGLVSASRSSTTAAKATTTWNSNAVRGRWPRPVPHCTQGFAWTAHRPRLRVRSRIWDIPRCCSCAPAMALAHRLPKHWRADTLPAG